MWILYIRIAAVALGKIYWQYYLSTKKNMVVQWAGSAVQSNMQISWLNEAMHTDHITDNHALTWNVYPYSTTVKTDNNSKLSK